MAVALSSGILRQIAINDVEVGSVRGNAHAVLYPKPGADAVPGYYLIED